MIGVAPPVLMLWRTTLFLPRSWLWREMISTAMLPKQRSLLQRALAFGPAAAEELFPFLHGKILARFLLWWQTPVLLPMAAKLEASRSGVLLPGPEMG